MLILLAIIALPTWAVVRAVRPRPSGLPRYESPPPPVLPPPAAAAAARRLGSLHPPGRAGQRTWTKTVNVMWSEAFLLENATAPRWPSDGATLLSNDACASAGSTMRIAVSTEGTST